jgi:hypothetical protein
VSTNNEYIAVSYAWGPPIAEHAIMLDGHKHMLPDNMWQFLKVWRLRLDQEGQDQQGRGHVTREMALRAPDFVSQASWHLWEACTDWLWIDALCIDQTNMQERMHQVRIMSKIFGGADEVLVWLGPANKAVDDLIKWSFWKSWTGGAPSPIQDRMAGLQDLCERSYWGRLWVFQELRCATKIALMCGSYTFPWTEFEKTFSEAMNVGENFSYSQRTKTELDQLKEVERLKLSAARKMVDLCRDAAPTSLWLLLQVTSHLECYDPRDRVYALLSLTKTGSEGVEANYDAALPQLMHRVVSNSHATNTARNVHEVTVRCARLKAVMRLQSEYPWGADEHLSTENAAPR